jgi:DNA-binding CsgD family transcriptional regulator/tetratricopeptide (TPR) repeat protein
VARVDAPLIGREKDLAVALDQLKRTGDGMSASLLLVGEAGIGKSRLAAEVLVRAEQIGQRVLVGRADEFDRGIPYAVFRDVLARLGQPGSADGEVAERLAELRQGLDVGVGASGGPADAHLRLVFSRAVDAFRALTEGSPTVLLVEDAHLADADSLALLALLTRLGDLPMLTIATLRPSSVAPARELQRLMERQQDEGQGAVIELAPLDRQEVHALVGATLGAAPAEDVVETVYAQGRGNPFFTLESVRALGDGDALLARVFGRDEPALLVARVVSAFGRFDLHHLPLAARLTGLSEAEVGETFDRLVREHMLVRDGEGGYEFAHSIVRDAVYEEIGPAERRRLHGAIADDLAQGRRAGTLLDIAELATHVAESADPGDERAIEILLEAGRTVAVTAPLVAAEHYAHAAALLPSASPRRAQALALRARALHVGARATEAAATGREALAALQPGPVRRATVALVVNGLSIAGRVTEALEVVEEELRREGDPGPLLAQRVHLLQNNGRAEEALALLPEALAAYRAAPPPQLIAATHLLIFANDTGDMELVEELLAEISAAAESGPPERRVIAHETIAVVDRRPGVLKSLEHHLDAARSLRPNPERLSIGGHYETALALCLWLRGDWDEALALYRSLAFELEQRGGAILAQALHSAECDLLVERGSVDLAAPIARALVPMTEEMTTPVALSNAKVKRALGEPEAAIALLTAQRERSHERRTTWKRAELLNELAQLLAEQDRIAEAREVAKEVIAWAERPCRYEVPLAALELRGLLWKDKKAARAYLERATEESMPFERARAGLLLGSLDVEPREHLTDAYRQFDVLGASPWRRRAATELRTRGITVPRPAQRPGAALTDTEARLVALVRDGLTNKQIASALHYSPKTVEVYLSRIYAKTGCASRVELVRELETGTVELPA